jgi:hypothetical protein
VITRTVGEMSQLSSARGLRTDDAIIWMTVQLWNAYRISVGMTEGKRPLGRQRRRWVDNIKMDLREIGWVGMDWIGLIWFRIGTSGGLL